MAHPVKSSEIRNGRCGRLNGSDNLWTIRAGGVSEDEQPSVIRSAMIGAQDRRQRAGSQIKAV
jgi:hypothetical protein